MKTPRNRSERGVATLYVLLLAVALTITLGMAFSLLYAEHKQTLKDKQELSARVDSLNAQR